MKTKSRIKTAQKHYKNLQLKSRVWLKSEIGAITKFLSSANYENDIEIKNAIHDLESYFNYGACEERKITREQSKYGIEYLLKRYFKVDGSPRKGCPFGEREISILKSFSRFRWVGVRAHYNNFGNMRWFTPVYRVYSKTGECFDYTAIHWGDPEILN